MNLKCTFSTLVILCQASFLFAQFIVNDQVFSANSVSNEGKVSGYSAQGGPYAIWLPDSNNVIIDIGGIAPGFGVGGQARFSTDGSVLCGTSQGEHGAEMAMFHRNTNEWTTLGSLGFLIDNSVSGGYAISGDGATVVGNSWADTSSGFAYTHAVAYHPNEGLMDLGSLFADMGRSTRANAVSQDGSVVVGWQDFNGPWKSAVWRKNPAGGYYPNEYILIDTTGNPNDEFNQLGECSAVSADGKWIGGYGDYANFNQPWIWSRDSGVINLGAFPNSGNGFVSGMSADGSTVVGWFNGQLWGDPQVPFIWTRAGGLRNLHEYINTVLGDSTGSYQVYSADCISPNGRYIAGYGIDNNTFNYFVYRVSLDALSDAPTIAASPKIKIYPNPTTDWVTIEHADKAIVTLRGIDGTSIVQTISNPSFHLNMSAYPPGVYLLSVQQGDKHLTQKLVKLDRN